MRAVDPRLLRYAVAARGYLTLAVALGLVMTGLIVAQAAILARLLAGAARGTGVTALATALAVLIAVVAGRASAVARAAAISSTRATGKPPAVSPWSLSGSGR